MAQVLNISYQTLGQYALAGSLMNGIGVLTKNRGFGATAMPLHLSIPSLSLSRPLLTMKHSLV